MDNTILHAVDSVGLIKSNAEVARTLLDEFQSRFLDKAIDRTVENACLFLYERDKMCCYIEAVSEFLFKAYDEADEILKELETQRKAIRESKTAETTDGEEDKAV